MPETCDAIVLGAGAAGMFCAGVAARIDRFDLWRTGAAALWITQRGLHVETARGQQGARPWVVRPEARARVFTAN